MNTGETPSAVLFEKLRRKIGPTDQTMHKLGLRKGSVYLRDEGVRALVIKTEGNGIHYLPVFDTEKNKTIPKKKREEAFAEVAFVGGQGYGVTLPYIRTRVPDMIGFNELVGIPHGKTQEDLKPYLNFAPQDPFMDDIFEKGAELFPKIETVSDLKSLTSWVNNMIPYNGRRWGPSLESDEGSRSVGQNMEQIGAVCRHMGVAKSGLLQLLDIESKPVAVTAYQLALDKSGAEFQRGRHLYLEVRIPGVDEIILSDPTSGLCEPERRFHRLNRSLGWIYRNRSPLVLQGYWA